MNTTSKNILCAGLGLFLLYILFFILSSTSSPLKFELKKAHYPFAIIENTETCDPIINLDDIKLDSSKTNHSDSLFRERVLLIGDSQLEGLRDPIYKYCNINNHDLVATVLWYGSTTKSWAESDTLSFFIEEYKPSYLFIALGLNELFVNDLENRRNYIKSILAPVKKSGIRYFWIGPAAWEKDKGITTLMAEMNGKFFYPSHNLKLDRCDDKMHPTRKGARIWMDSVATYVTSLGKYGLDLNIKKDTTIKIINSPLIIIPQSK